MASPRHPLRTRWLMLPTVLLVAACGEGPATTTSGTGGGAETSSVVGSGGMGGSGGTMGSGGTGGTGGTVVVSEHTVGGTVTGLHGSLEVSLGGEPLEMAGDGDFVFPTAIPDGTAYEITIISEPDAQRCRVDNASGTIAGADVSNIAVRCDDLVFFHADDGVVGSELWVTDGTEAGTVLLKDIHPAGDSGNVFEFAVRVGDRFVFNASDGTHGTELWATDGTAAGTALIADNAPGGASKLFDLSNSRFLGEVLLAPAADALWTTDGTAAGTSLIVDTWPGGNAHPRPLAAAGQQMLFYAKTEFSNRPVWKTDGTPEGTTIIAGPTDHITAISSNLGVSLGNVVVFRGEGDGLGLELWKSDGTEAGTGLLRDIHPNGIGNPRFFRLHAGEVFFQADDGTHGVELWTTDGTPEGTVLVSDITAGATSSSPSGFVSLDATTLLFRANSTEVWKTDGTEAGTELVKSFTSVGDLARVGDRVVFSADDGVAGFEPWVTDGTEAGTVILADINPGAGDSEPSLGRAHVGDQMLFIATDATHGTELYATDGTPAGTYLIKDILPGPDD